MKTIFSDIKINDPNATTQPSSQFNIPIMAQLPLRMSISPQKHTTSKKFFYPARNKSFASEQIQTKKQLETLLKKQKIILMGQRTQINDLLIPLQALDCEKELMIFPSLQIKKINENKPGIESPVKKVQKTAGLELRLEDIRKDYHSNILGSLSVETRELQNPKNYASQRKIEQKQKLRNSVIMPKINRSKVNPPISPQKDVKIVKTNPQLICPSPNLLNRNQSLIQLQPATISLDKKKYKKGYLSYEPGGIQFWKKIKQNLNEQAKIQVSDKIITAKTFFALDLDTLMPLVKESADQDIQIASLSKIMTCYLSIIIAKKYEVDLKNWFYRVPDWITQTPGTSAQLQAGDVLSAYDLIYALMLPSGNDASICLAELMGKILQKHRKSDQKKTYIQTFLSHMNAFSKELGLNQEWGNSSGLSNNPNFSTAKGIVALAALALRDQTFSNVVNTQLYEVNIKNDRYGLSRKRGWRNTNKLLEKGWSGVKTGTTESAGHCLMAKKDNILIAVFDCQTLSKRFSDAVKLSDFIITQSN